MRVSTLQLFHSSISSMSSAQEEILNAQQQISTGNKLINDSDDPVASSQIKMLKSTQNQIIQFQANISTAQGQLSTEESALTTTKNVLSKVSQQVIYAANASLTHTDRAVIASQISSQLNQVMSLANSKDPDGNYLFSGSQLKVQPFINGSGGVVYQGDLEQRYINVASNNYIAVSDNGYTIFNNRNGYVATSNSNNTGTGVMSSVRLSPGYTPDDYTVNFTSAPGAATTYTVLDSSGAQVVTGNYVDGGAITFNGMQVSVTGTPANNDSYSIGRMGTIFDTLQSLVNTINTATNSASSQAQFSTAINNQLSALSDGIDVINNTLSDVGVRSSITSNMSTLMQNLSLQNAKSLSNLSDVDLTAAVSQLAQQTTALTAMQSIYIKTSKLSLFDMM